VTPQAEEQNKGSVNIYIKMAELNAFYIQTIQTKQTVCYVIPLAVTFLKTLKNGLKRPFSRRIIINDT